MKVCNDQELAQSERTSHSENQALKRTYRRPSEQLLSNRRSLSDHLTENMKTYIMYKQHTNTPPKHKTTRTTTEVLPWYEQ